MSGMGRLKLNPNAAEFVPSSLKTSSATTKTESSTLVSDKQGNQTKVLNRTDSDDERRQYWKDQLPDDIIPDFSIGLEEDEDRLAFG